MIDTGHPEASSDYYDEIFRTGKNYRPENVGSYREFMEYRWWKKMISRFNACAGVLDLGCGPGMFAEFLLHETECPKYVGLDFSPEAVERGSIINRKWNALFAECDLNKVSRETLALYAPEGWLITIIAVLEHLTEDRALVEKLPPGRRCIFLVPNCNALSHVRYFETPEDVATRYGPFFDRSTVTTYARTLGNGTRRRIYIFDGIKS